LAEVLRGLASSGRTLLLTSHDDDFVRDVASRVVILANGRVVEEGDPHRVLDDAQHEETRRLLRVERQGRGRAVGGLAAQDL
jgi:ABC-type histidine transport system ATPase subunit